MAQMRALDKVLANMGWHLHLALVEGDSKDNTWQLLHSLSGGLDVSLGQKHHHGPVFGPVLVPLRLSNKCLVDNCAMNLVRPDADRVIFVESDLTWTPATIVKLLAHLDTVPCATVMVYCRHFFRDTWGFRLNGKQFGNNFPFHDDLDWTRLNKLDSCGSIIAMRGEYKNCRFTPSDEFLGLCADIKRHSGSIWLDPSLSVIHP